MSLTLNGENVTVLTLTNNAANTQTTQAQTTTALFLSSDVAGLSFTNPVVSLGASTGFVTLASGESPSFGPLADAGSFVLNPMGNLFSVAGGGCSSISCESLSGISILGGGGHIASDQSTQAACGASINYEYTTRTTQVLEPATLALLGLAVVGAGVARRKFA